jgi:hypothetical protein
MASPVPDRAITRKCRSDCQSRAAPVRPSRALHHDRHRPMMEGRTAGEDAVPVADRTRTWSAIWTGAKRRTGPARRHESAPGEAAPERRSERPANAPERRVRDADRVTDWMAWHEAYDDPSSSLARRLGVVRRRLGAVLDAAAGERRQLLSLCAGDGRDVIPVLAARAASSSSVSALLVEWHEGCHGGPRTRRPRPASRQWKSVALMPVIRLRPTTFCRSTCCCCPGSSAMSSTGA